jgi:hypothetical protein
MTGDENFVERAMQVGEGLTRLSLEQLGFEPRLEDLTEDHRSRLDADELEWAPPITPGRRDRSLFQAKLLAGALWEASAVLIDQLFEDLDGLHDLERVDRRDIADTFVLSGLPTQARRQIRRPVRTQFRSRLRRGLRLIPCPRHASNGSGCSERRTQSMSRYSSLPEPSPI